MERERERERDKERKMNIKKGYKKREEKEIGHSKRAEGEGDGRRKVIKINRRVKNRKSRRE